MAILGNKRAGATSAASSASHAHGTAASKKIHSPRNTPRVKKAALKQAAPKRASATSSAASSAATTPRSAPSSPAQRPVPLADKKADNMAEHKQDTLAVPTPAAAAASPASPSSKSPAATPSPAPESSLDAPAPIVSTSGTAFTLSEQKMVDTIRSVETKIQQIAFQLPTLRGQISYHLARIALFRWNASHPQRIKLDAAQLHLSHKRLAYEAGMIDESTLQQIFRLDSVQTDNDDIRKARKAAVQRGNANIKASVELRDRLKRIAKLLPPEPQREVESASMEDILPASQLNATTEAKQESTAMQQSTDAEEEEEEEEKEQVQEPVKQPEPARKSPQPQRVSPQPPAQPTAEPIFKMSALERKYASLQLPKYAGPQIYSRVLPNSGALQLEADLEGVQIDDLSVVPDVAARTITVQGVRLPERRRSVPGHAFGGLFGGSAYGARMAPHGFFTRQLDLSEIDPSELLDLSRLQASVTRNNHLQINIPRLPRQQPQQQFRRAPVQHSTGYSYSSDEEEQQQSHPYQQYHAPQYAQRQPQYRRAPAQHPFFGGFF